MSNCQGVTISHVKYGIDVNHLLYGSNVLPHYHGSNLLSCASVHVLALNTNFFKKLYLADLPYKRYWKFSFVCMKDIA